MIEMGIGAHLTRILADDGEQVSRALLSEARGQCRDGRPAASLTTTVLPRKRPRTRSALFVWLFLISEITRYLDTVSKCEGIR